MRRIVLAVFLILSVTGLLLTLALANGQNELTNQAMARQVFEEVFSRGRLDLVDKLYGEEYVDDSVGGGSGRDFLRRAVSGWRAEFPDLRISVNDLLTEKDKVVVRWTAHGTNSGKFNGLPATAKQASVRGITIFQFGKGKIQKEWTAFDRMSLLQQLGIMPQQQ